jgi:hypothetical protein
MTDLSSKPQCTPLIRPLPPTLPLKKLDRRHFEIVIGNDVYLDYKQKWNMWELEARINHGFQRVCQSAGYICEGWAEYDGLTHGDIVTIYLTALSALPDELKQKIDDPLFGKPLNLVPETYRESFLSMFRGLRCTILQWQPDAELIEEQTKNFKEYLEKVDDPTTSYPLDGKHCVHLTEFQELMRTYPSCETLLSLRTQWNITRRRSLERLHMTCNEKEFNWEESGTPSLSLMRPILAGDY